MAGKFIVLEGVDQVVLEAQANHLVAWLQEQQFPVIITREPTAGPVGGQVQLALDGRLILDTRTLAVLSVADRMDHLQREEGGILRHLAEGRHVICVGYALADYAHLSDAHLSDAHFSDANISDANISDAVSLEWLIRINQLCVWPDLVIVVDVKTTADDDMRNRYLYAVEQCCLDGKNIVVVDGNQADDGLRRACQDLVKQFVLGE